MLQCHNVLHCRVNCPSRASSFRFNSSVADDFAPTRGLLLLEFRHLRWAADRGKQVQVVEALFGFGRLTMSLMVLLSFEMIGAGVFGGALMAFQVSETK